MQVCSILYLDIFLRLLDKPPEFSLEMFFDRQLLDPIFSLASPLSEWNFSFRQRMPFKPILTESCGHLVEASERMLVAFFETVICTGCDDASIAYPVTSRHSF